MNVFVSYTLRDSIVTEEYLRTVSDTVAEFAKPFVDIIHNEADDKQGYVMEQLDRSNLVLLITTSSITTSKWVMAEVNRAKSKSIPIIRIPLIVDLSGSLDHIRAILPSELKKLISY